MPCLRQRFKILNENLRSSSFLSALDCLIAHFNRHMWALKSRGVDPPRTLKHDTIPSFFTSFYLLKAPLGFTTSGNFIRMHSSPCNDANQLLDKVYIYLTMQQPASLVFLLRLILNLYP